MPQKIQRIAPGLLSFLGLKGTGQNPTDLGEVVAPIVDLTPFYHAVDLQSTAVNSPGLTVAGSAATIEVPAGETWRMVAAGYVANTLTAGGIVHVSILFQPPGSTLAVCIAPPLRFVAGAGAATERHDIGFFFPMPFYAPTGSQFIMLVEEAVTTGSINLTARATYQRLLS